MKLSVLVFALLCAVLAGAMALEETSQASRSLQTIGQDDFEAVEAVGEAAMMTGLEMKHAKAKILKAKAKEAQVAYKADRRVAKTVQHAMRHAESPLDLDSHDAKRIAKAIAHAKASKAKAKVRTVKVVVKSVGDVAATGIAYGGPALLKVSQAALNDIHTFMPFLAGLNASFPQLAGGDLSGLGPRGLQHLLGGLAQGIGSALLPGIGVAGPDLLASRVAQFIPDDLLASFVPALLGGGEGGEGGPLGGLIANLPPGVLDTLVGFLSGGGAAGAGELPRMGASDILPLPAGPLSVMLGGLRQLLGGGGPLGHGLDLQLPALPSGGLPMPIKLLSNLLGVLPVGPLQDILGMLPRGPLGGLLSALPLGLIGAP